MAQKCGHTICSKCLGLTCLITVDRYICLACWRVPRDVMTSWYHNPGEMRLHLEGQVNNTQSKQTQQVIQHL